MDVRLKNLDRFQQIAADAEYAAVVLRNGDDVQLINLQTVPADVAEGFRKRGLSFGGIVGLVDGKPCVALDHEDPEAEKIIRDAFVQHVRSHMNWRMAPAEA